MAYRKIPFQKWRIFFFAAKHAGAAGATEDPALVQAHTDLARLATDAMKAIDAGPGVAQSFYERLEEMIAQSRRTTGISELDAMLQRQREQDRGY